MVPAASPPEMANGSDAPRSAEAGHPDVALSMEKAPQVPAGSSTRKRRLAFTVAALAVVLAIAGALLFVFVHRASVPPRPQVSTTPSTNTTGSVDSGDKQAGGDDSSTLSFIGSFGGGWKPTLGASNLGDIPGIAELTESIDFGTPALPSLGRQPAAGLSLAGLPSIPIPTLFSPLKSASAGTGRLIGAIHNEGRVWDLQDAAETARYERHLIDQYDIITPENACKTSVIFPDGLASPVWTLCDRIVDWTEANSLKMRMHVTAWGDWNPQWINELPPSGKRAALLDTMRAVLTRYKDRAHIVYWDIVNEAVCDDVLLTPAKQNCEGLGRAEDRGLLKGGDYSSWYPDVPDYIDAAFYLARQILGTGRVLVYNDYGFESTRDIADKGKHERVYGWVRSALLRGVPIDAVGFQFHIANIHNAEGIVGSTLFGGYMDGVKEQFDKVAALGVEVHVTEIDVGCNFPTLPCPAPFLNYNPGARQVEQAGVFAKVLSHCLSTPACTAYQMWGSTDRYSWRDGNWGEGNSLASWYNQYAHIFDIDYQPKLAAYAMLGVLKFKQLDNAMQA